MYLLGCGRSQQAEFFMLNPIPPSTTTNSYRGLHIGIDSIDTPAYTEKPQMIIYDGVNRVQMKEFDQWAETLDKTIRRVIKTNLTTLLPGAIIEQAPWDIKFKPDYHLDVILSDFKITLSGDSNLRASYIVYHHEELIKKYDVFYHIKIPQPQITIENLVGSMNANLTHLTRDIAQTFRTLS